jgi:hypothetical protein
MVRTIDLGVSTGRARHLSKPATDQPDRVSGELRVARWLELIHCADQRDATFLRQIGQGHAATPK